VSANFKYRVVVCASLALAACGDRSMPTSPDAQLTSQNAAIANEYGGAQAPAGTRASSEPWTSTFSSPSSGGTVKEVLSGPAIDDVVPEGLAIADQSKFLIGGSTIFTLQVKKVNLPDGTVLGITLDFTPIGSITLSRGEGTMRADLGHFAVSRDQVRVKNGDMVILSGGFFQ
jgi:hypothetical protein